MGVHPSGDGAAWDALEDVDIDQPHGKDYLYSQHIAKAVRKRLEQEHADFADATVGGIHVPGGCAVLGIEDGTDTILADATLKGHGIVWDNTSRLWCSTATPGAAATGDWTLVLINPDKQWGGGDVTWAGAHEFDASVDISGNVAMDGDLTIDGKLVVDNSADFSDVHIAGTLHIDLACDMTNTTIDGTLTVYDTADFSQVNISGLFGAFADWSGGKIADTTYTAASDGFATGWIQHANTNSLIVYGQTPEGTTRIMNSDLGNNQTFYVGVTFPVKKGDTYAIIADDSGYTASTLNFLPIGANA